MDLKDILGSDILADLSKAAGDQADPETISKVLSAALPAIAKNNEQASSSAKRSASGDRGMTDVLFSLLGDNSSDVTQSVAESTGVSQNQVGGILSAAAPLLLKLLGSNSSSGSGSNMLSMITGLLGSKDEKDEKEDNSSDILSMVTGFLGGKDEKDEKEDNSSDILSMVTGFLGGKDEKDEKEDSKDDSLGSIVNLAASLLGDK